MDPLVTDAIRAVQPYRAVPPYQEVPDPDWGIADHVLALLSSFQNADKHRELTVIAQGLRPRALRFTLPDGTRTYQEADPLPSNLLLRDDAVVERLDVEVEMELEGEIDIVIGRTLGQGPVRTLKTFAHSLLEFVHDKVFVPVDNLHAAGRHNG